MRTTLGLAALLALSAAANALLLDDRSWVSKALSDSGQAVQPAQVVSAKQTPLPELASAKFSSPQKSEIWSALYRSDPAEFLRRLRSAGFPGDMLRALVVAQIEESFRTREDALRPPKKDADFWWKPEASLSLAKQLALLDLRREKMTLRSQLLGPDREADDAPLYDNLPEGKREAVRLVGEDYELRLKALRGDMNMLLPSERTQIAQLEAERNRALGDLLSPDELEEYRIRISRTTDGLRRRWGSFDATDEEFHTIFEIQKALDETGHVSPDDERHVHDEFLDAFGAVRGEQVARALNYDFQNLRQLVLRSNLPPENAEQVFSLRDAMALETARLGADSTLSNEQKLAAFQALAEKTKSEITAKLGPDASAAYLLTGAPWLKAVAQGEIVSFANGGWQAEGFSHAPGSAAVPSAQVVLRPRFLPAR